MPEDSILTIASGQFLLAGEGSLLLKQIMEGIKSILAIHIILKI
jgi:hypothetical protein